MKNISNRTTAPSGKYCLLTFFKFASLRTIPNKRSINSERYICSPKNGTIIKEDRDPARKPAKSENVPFFNVNAEIVQTGRLNSARDKNIKRSLVSLENLEYTAMASPTKIMM